MNSSRARLMSLVCLLCLAIAARAESRAASIRDDAGLFHSDAVARAEQRIDDIRRTFHRNLFVQTVASASAHQRRLFPFLRTPQANRLLEEQARKYADESGLPGIYVVICTKPHDVHVVVRPTNDAEFTRHDGEAIRRTLARRLEDRDRDAALLGLVEQVYSLLQAHATRGDSHTVVNEFVFAGLLGGGLGLWLLLGTIRFKMRPSQPATPTDEDATMQACGAPALLGAMFGFPAGFWIYDKLYPCSSATPLASCEPEPESKLKTADESMEAIDSEDQLREEHSKDAPVSP